MSIHSYCGYVKRLALVTCLMIGIGNLRLLTFGNSSSSAVDDEAVVAVRATRHERRSIRH